MTTKTSPAVSVIVCAYTEDRWDDLCAAVASLQGQTIHPLEVIVVIDHHPRLLERAQREFPGATVIPNAHARGLSGARNSGIAQASGDILAFMDEDAQAAPDWLEQLLAAYEDESVLGVGGAILPEWIEAQPAWFPAEFGWVVGCSYLGLPETVAPVRNLIGCNMSLRRDVFAQVGTFISGIGRVGTNPVGCEETELCIRARQRWPAGRLLYQPAAQVRHRVPAGRATWKYFLHRCYSEGLSKAQVTGLVGAQDGLSSERAYTYRTLPAGVLRGLGDSLRGRSPSGLLRAAAIVAGFSATLAGYGVGRMKRLVSRPESPPAEPVDNLPDPLRVLEIELSQPLAVIPAGQSLRGLPYHRALALVRLHQQPIGVVELELTPQGLSPADCIRQVWAALAVEINAHLQADGLPPAPSLSVNGLIPDSTPLCQLERQRELAGAPPASVVIATRDRAESLALTLDSLLAMEVKAAEIVVVDNAPSTAATAELIRQRYAGHPQIRYVREDRPGLSVAHNRGVREASFPIVAFTDDDVEVDAWWLGELLRGFTAGERVACVTGMIFPAELETPAQVWIEQYGGFNKGFHQKVFELAHPPADSPLFPFTAGHYGSGASMAFKTADLKVMGGFDPATGTGTPAMGGDDLSAFFQVIVDGYQLVYQPGAILHHKHRRDYPGLRRQAYGYGVGLTAFLTKTLIDRPGLLIDFLGRIPAGVRYLFHPGSAKNAKKKTDYPVELNRLERKGMLYGPLAYLRSRRQARRLDAIAPSRPATGHKVPQL